MSGTVVYPHVLNLAMTSDRRRPADDKLPSTVFTVINANDYDKRPTKPSLMMKFRISFVACLHSATNFVTTLTRRRLSWGSRDSVDRNDIEHEEGRLVVPQKKGVIMPKARLERLPLELQVEIFMKLEWMDLLRARQTCKPLYQASTTRLIWICFLDEFMAEAKVKPKLERPIELYNSAELERVFLQWTTVEPGWTTRGMKHARQRDIIDREAAAFQLVEGGRWLLLATRTGSITYHDLDHPDIPERVLIPDQVEWHDTLGVSMAVDIDETEPVLTFNLALSVKRPKCHNALGIAFGQICRVHLELDDGQQEHTLQFRQLVFFPLRRDGYISSLSLLGRFVAFYHMSLERNLPPRIVVICWLDAVAGEGDNSQWLPADCPERVIYPGRHEGKIRLIPGNRLIVASQSSVRLYNILNVQPSSTSSDSTTASNIQTPHSWSFTFEYLSVKSLSKPFTVSSSTNKKSVRVVVFTSSAIHGIILPMNQPTVNPRSVKLMTYRLGDFNSASLGYNRGVISCYVPHQLVMLSYSWPDENVEEKLFYKKVICEHPMKPVVDERSGHVVVSASAGAHFVVLDTALNRRI